MDVAYIRNVAVKGYHGVIVQDVEGPVFEDITFGRRICWWTVPIAEGPPLSAAWSAILQPLAATG